MANKPDTWRERLDGLAIFFADLFCDTLMAATTLSAFYGFSWVLGRARALGFGTEAYFNAYETRHGQFSFAIYATVCFAFFLRGFIAIFKKKVGCKHFIQQRWGELVSFLSDLLTDTVKGLGLLGAFVALAEIFVLARAHGLGDSVDLGLYEHTFFLATFGIFNGLGFAFLVRLWYRLWRELWSETK